MKYLNIIALVLSVWRITEIATTQDGPFGIFKHLRPKLKVMQCPFCFSVWASMIGLALYRYWPIANAIFAISWSYGFSSLFARGLATWARGDNKKAGRELLIVEANGQVNVTRTDFTVQEQANIYSGFLNLLSRQQQKTAPN